MIHLKKIIYVAVLIGVFLTGCNPNDEIYDDLDKAAEPYTKKIEIALEGTDYSEISEMLYQIEDTTAGDIIDNNNYFSEQAPAADHVPLLLNDRYPEYGKGSKAIVTYDYYLGEKTFEFNNRDYEWFADDSISNNQYFYSDNPPEDNIPDYLVERYPTPEESITLEVKYNYFDGSTTETRISFYDYNEGEWNKVEDTYTLKEKDYDSMGPPGDYDNFTSDIPPEEYLPTFLGLKYPYASQGDKRYVIFEFFTGDDSNPFEIRSQEYHYDSTGWTHFENMETRTSQFVRSKGKWVFDPTVRFTMTSSDYQIVVDAVEKKFGKEFLDEYGTGEFYTGASAYYSNFDLRLQPRQDDYPDEYGSYSDEELKDLIIQRLVVAMKLLLQNKYPDAVPEVSGVDVHYIVTFESYNNNLSRSTWKADMLCTSAGDPPQFELVDNTFIRDGEEFVVPSGD
ncbi:MAG: hypothetical protein K9I74_13690 [Bacteroidales bacterium]|nr:hypothetical protein [Bacteroidales bacterium]